MGKGVLWRYVGPFGGVGGMLFVIGPPLTKGQSSLFARWLRAGAYLGFRKARAYTVR